jgi:hypothetical protein
MLLQKWGSTSKYLCRALLCPLQSCHSESTTYIGKNIHVAYAIFTQVYVCAHTLPYHCIWSSSVTYQTTPNAIWNFTLISYFSLCLYSVHIHIYIVIVPLIFLNKQVNVYIYYLGLFSNSISSHTVCTCCDLLFCSLYYFSYPCRAIYSLFISLLYYIPLYECNKIKFYILPLNHMWVFFSFYYDKQCCCEHVYTFALVHMCHFP